MNNSFELPPIDYAALAPMLILFGAAAIGVLVEAFVPRGRRHPVQVGLSMAALVAALAVVIWQAGTKVITIGGAVAVDGPALFLQGTILLLAIVGLLLIGERALEPGGPFVAQAAITVGSEADRRQAAGELGAAEVYPLALFATGGMMLFVSANDLLTMFVALEVLSLPLYLLCGMARRRRLLSQEAAMKYFLLGAFASAFFLFGIALLYGYAGRLDLAGMHEAVQGSRNSPVLLFAGLAMVAVGLLFKTSAAPFHVWTPDVYQGAPTPITGFMAAATKVAAFGALLRVLYVGFQGVQWDFKPVLAAVAILTMLLGAVLAVTQTDIKRLLAYSSIANAGYALVGVLALTRDGLSYTMFYLAAYGFAVIGAFAIVTLVRDANGEATHLSRWAGLGKRSPVLSAVFTLFLLAFAGIPLTSGFTSKFAVFAAALGAPDDVGIWLVIAGVISSVILAFPYLRVVVMMWLSEPGETTPSVSLPGVPTAAALTVGVFVTLLLGLYPPTILDLTNRAAEFIR